ncbi:MAG: hypothetical protein NC828_03375 [Candidatus Omnitrophica bacterium]|nr:hypothetical protein [Candidatus Omnitrophota bacterium]
MRQNYKKFIVFLVFVSFLSAERAYSQLAWVKQELYEGLTLRTISFSERSASPTTHPYLKRKDGSPIEIEPFTETERRRLALLEDSEGNPIDASQLSREEHIRLISNAIAEICDKRGVKFLKMYVLDPKSGGIISYSIAPRSAITKILSRGVAMDGSSLDEKLVTNLIGTTLTTKPQIGGSDTRAMPDIDIGTPAAFLLHREQDGSFSEEASLRFALYNPDAEEVQRARQVDYVIQLPPIAEVRLNNRTEEEYAQVYKASISEVEQAIRDNGITDLTLVYGDITGESREVVMAAPTVNGRQTPDGLIDELRQRNFFYAGIPFTGDVRNLYLGNNFFPPRKRFSIMPKIPTFRIVQIRGERKAVMVGQIQESGLAIGTIGSHRTCLAYPRNALKEASGYSTSEGETTDIAPEIEFYLKPLGKKEDMPMIGYHRSFEGTPYEDIIKDMMLALESIGEEVNYGHAEVGSTNRIAQFEFVLGHGPAFKTITTKELHKWVLQKVALAHGFEVTFTPKPIPQLAGNGMHVHISLNRNGVNLFYNPASPRELSETGKQFMAGVLRYLPEIQCLINQTDNSYERLVPGYEAPVYGNCWGEENRTTVIRIPRFIVAEKDARFELRLPDSGGNLYLVLFAIITAGNKGIEEKLDINKFVYINQGENLYYMSATEKAQRGITHLNSSLYEALYQAYHSHFFRRVVPNGIRQYFYTLFLRRTDALVAQLKTRHIVYGKEVNPNDIFIAESLLGHDAYGRYYIGNNTKFLGPYIYIKGRNITIGGGARIGRNVRITTEGSLVKVGKGKELVNGTISIGERVFIGNGTIIIARDNGEVQIEANCKIPPNSKFVANKNQIVKVKRRRGNKIEVIIIDKSMPTASVSIDDLTTVDAAI